MQVGRHVIVPPPRQLRFLVVAMPLLRFDDFELESWPIRIASQRPQREAGKNPPRVLLMERGGQFVSRQEIVERLWGRDVFLDTEPGINTAVRKIHLAAAPWPRTNSVL
jgi:hypothetical protein